MYQVVGSRWVTCQGTRVKDKVSTLRVLGGPNSEVSH